MIDSGLALVIPSCAGAGTLFAYCLQTVSPTTPMSAVSRSATHDEAAIRYGPSPDDRERDDPIPPVVVRLLGPVAVEVDGQAIASPSVVELVAYLVTHRQGVSDERLRTALWPERVVSGATFNNLVSLARRQLGRGGDASLNLPHADGRRYRVGADVVSDWEQLGAAAKAMATRQSATSVDQLEQVILGLGGIPFEARRGFEWAHEEGLPGAASSDVGRAAAILVDFLREGAEDERAEKVALVALRACPGDERLERVWQPLAPGSTRCSGLSSAETPTSNARQGGGAPA